MGPRRLSLATRRALRKLSKITAPLCATCPTAGGEPTRCCSRDFCEIADKQARLVGHAQDRVNDAVPFLGPNGCVMPPEYRPGCTGFLCPSARTKVYVKRHAQLVSVCEADPVFVAMRDLGAKCSESILWDIARRSL